MINDNIIGLKKVSIENKIKSKHDKDAMLLLSNNNDSEEINILKAVGLDNNIRAVENVQKNIDRKSILRNKYSRNVFTGGEIRKFCIKNFYQIQRADDFKGEIPIELAKAIIDFKNENIITKELGDNRVVTNTEINLRERNFYLLLPMTSFITNKLYKSTTLLYSEEPVEYDKASMTDNFIEIKSWNNPTSIYDRITIDFFTTFSSPLGFGLLITLFCGLLFTIFNAEWLLLIPFIITSLCVVTLNYDMKDCWNTKIKL